MHWKQVHIASVCSFENSDITNWIIEDADIRLLRITHTLVKELIFKGTVIMSQDQHDVFVAHDANFADATIRLKPVSTSHETPITSLQNCLVPGQLRETLTQLAHYLMSSHVEPYYASHPFDLEKGCLHAVDHQTGKALQQWLINAPGELNHQTLQALQDILKSQTPLINSTKDMLHYQFGLILEPQHRPSLLKQLAHAFGLFSRPAASPFPTTSSHDSGYTSPTSDLSRGATQEPSPANSEENLHRLGPETGLLANY